MVLITIVVSVYLAYTGYTYYQLPLEERWYHEHHDWFKPSGLYGHGLGIIGTLLILFGVVIYIARKRYNFLHRYIRLKYLLEFHIFLCVLGPIMILFHTAFKFGGIVSVAFWSMVAVVASGVIGRFIYIQIPRTIEGRALSKEEITRMQAQLTNEVILIAPNHESSIRLLMEEMQSARKAHATDRYLQHWMFNRRQVRKIRQGFQSLGLPSGKRDEVLRLLKQEMSLELRIQRLETMQQFFKYWHVAHLPFALIMLIIVVIHVVVTLTFGYKWIF
jgi:hypothetical protein